MRHHPGILCAGLVGATLLGSPLARADTVVVNDQPAPESDEVTVVTTTNTPAIATGLVTFGVAYGVAAIGASMSDNSADHRLYVPLLGPWLDLADRPDCPVAQASCDSQTTTKILIGVDGVFQAIGIVAALYGVFSPRHHAVGRDSTEVVPISMGHGGSGLALTGTF